jgi:hypothetical protein
MNQPFVIRVIRTRKRPPVSPVVSFRKFCRKSLSEESLRWSVVELILFGALAAASAWPIIRSFEAMRFL